MQIIFIDIDADDIYARRHNLLDIPLGKIKNGRNHLLFFLADHAFLLSYGKQAPNFFLGQKGLM